MLSVNYSISAMIRDQQANRTPPINWSAILAGIETAVKIGFRLSGLLKKSRFGLCGSGRRIVFGQVLTATKSWL
jgi:hypothetical protein